MPLGACDIAAHFGLRPAGLGAARPVRYRGPAGGGSQHAASATGGAGSSLAQQAAVEPPPRRAPRCLLREPCGDDLGSNKEKKGLRSASISVAHARPLSAHEVESRLVARVDLVR